MSGFSVTPDSMNGLATAMGDYGREIANLQNVKTADLMQFASAQVIEYVEDFDRSLNSLMQMVGSSMQEMELLLRQGARQYTTADQSVSDSLPGRN